MEMKNPPHKSNITLVLGANGSGKSLFAEGLAVEAGPNRIYLATMVSQNEDNEKRIKKHRLQRCEKGFITIEKDWNIDTINTDENAVILLEDLTNLLANGIFIHHQTAQDALDQTLALASRCKELIIVSIDGLCGEGYDKETASYIHGINTLNSRLSALASSVYLMKDGAAVLQKG